VVSRAVILRHAVVGDWLGHEETGHNWALSNLMESVGQLEELAPAVHAELVTNAARAIATWRRNLLEGDPDADG
jgi:hypothetical protein